MGQVVEIRLVITLMNILVIGKILRKYASASVRFMRYSERCKRCILKMLKYQGSE